MTSERIWDLAGWISRRLISCAAQRTPDSLSARLEEEWHYTVEPAALNRGALHAYISQAAAKNPQPQVHLMVAKFARYEIVAQILADLEFRGLKKIGFVNNEYF